MHTVVLYINSLVVWRPVQEVEFPQLECKKKHLNHQSYKYFSILEVEVSERWDELEDPTIHKEDYYSLQ
jgi:hypothetical protein